MCTRNANLFDYVFRTEAALSTQGLPAEFELGNFVRLVGWKTFVFPVKGGARKILGGEIVIHMTRTNPPESAWAAPFASQRREFAARWYVFVSLLAAKNIRARRLYRHDELKWILALRVDGRDLGDVLHARGFTA